MLPFLKQKRVAGLIIAQRKPDGGQEQIGSEGEEDQGLMACAEDLIRCMHAKDAEGVAAAMRSAFEILEAEPHEEASQDDEQPSE